MFQLFSRANSRNFFKARSAYRDIETDQSRIAAIGRSIDIALEAAEAEHAGLNRRVDEVVARASVTFGNDSDEYLTRDPLDNLHQDMLGSEIEKGQKRLRELAVSIGHFKFLKAALMERFPEYETLAEPESAGSAA